MEQREGYKKTAIGWIPEDWDIVKLADIGETYNGLTGKTKDDFGKGKPYIPYMNIFSSSRINLEIIDYVEIIEGEQQNSIEYGDIIFTTSSETPYEVGMSSVLLDKVTDKIYLNSFCFGFRMYDFKWLLPSYARFLFRGEKVRKIISVLAQGSTRFNLSKKALLSKLHLSLPPLPEQNKIASILTTVDDKISSIDSQIQQTEQLKKGLMEKLLTEGIGHTEFKETEIGRIPVGWDVKPLGSIGEFLKGKGIAKKDLAEKGLPCVRYGEIYTVHHWIIKSFHSFISSETASQSKEIRKNDILFAGSGETVEEIGKAVAYLYQDKAYAGGDIIILRPENVDSAFVSACLDTTNSNKQKRKLGQGNSVVHIYPTGLKQVLIPLPPLPEQKQIAIILSTVDDKLDILNQKKSHYQTLKKGLSQQLLTGQMRVKV